jgi:hypothetical protein
MPYVSGPVVKLSTVIIFIPSGVEGAWSSELSGSKVIRERVLESYLGRIVCAQRSKVSPVQNFGALVPETPCSH